MTYLPPRVPNPSTDHRQLAAKINLRIAKLTAALALAALDEPTLVKLCDTLIQAEAEAEKFIRQWPAVERPPRAPRKPDGRRNREPKAKRPPKLSVISGGGRRPTGVVYYRSRTICLGEYGSRECDAAYAEFIAKWKAENVAAVSPTPTVQPMSDCYGDLFAAS